MTASDKKGQDSEDQSKKLINFVLKMSQDATAAHELRQDPDRFMASHGLSAEATEAIKAALEGDTSLVRKMIPSQDGDRHQVNVNIGSQAIADIGGDKD